MTQEEKQLLLKDLCVRLPYRVAAYASEINKNGIITDVNITYNMVNLTVDNADGKYELVPLFDIKPYLRPMSSMTEEEAFEMCHTVFHHVSPIGVDIESDRFRFKTIDGDGHFSGHIIFFFDKIYSLEHFDWLNANHFDYRGLIEKGLALEAPEDMYKTK